MDLRAWFDSLTHGKIMKMLGEAESQVLDCKRIGDEGDMKKNLAVVLSGFANAQGGVCLWGLTAKKNAQQVDCIDAFPGIADARRMASRLDELTPQAVSPGVPGVVHRALTTRGNAAGFVATYVPASAEGPHMARFGEDRYHQRIGLSFLRMEPFQIADMFGRRARPVLSVDAVQWNSYEYRVRITNSGRGVARGLFLQLSVPGPFMRNSYGVDGNHGEPLKYSGHSPDGSWLHASGATDLLHPTMSISVGGVWLGLDPSVPLRAGSVPEILRITYKVGALDLEPEQGVLEVRL